MILGPVLVVAAHADDEALGCGGTMARLAAAGLEVYVLLLADGESSRAKSADQVDAGSVKARNEAAWRASRVLRCKGLEIADFPDNRMDGVDLLDVVKRIEGSLERLRPRTVFTHHFGDVNVDHKIVYQAVLAATRPQPACPVSDIFLFEVPSSTEWRPGAEAVGFAPTLFIDISTQLETKLDALREYASEMRPFPHPRSIEAVTALARWRGATAGVEAAEAFVVARSIVKADRQ